MLEKKFGPLTPQVLTDLETFPAEKLEELPLAVLDAESLDVLGFGQAPSAK